MLADILHGLFEKIWEEEGTPSEWKEESPDQDPQENRPWPVLKL